MHDKNPNVETLNMIYQGSKMGVEAIIYLLPKINNQNLKKELATQMLGYHNFVKSSSQHLYDINHYPQDVNLMAKLPAYTAIQVKSAVDSSSSHIAEMMIEGSSAGIIEVQRNLNKHKNLTQEVAKIGQDIISFEEENISKLKSYL